jgi:hypothetical protein
LNFASSKGGTLGTPTVGEFKNGRGEFFDQETFDGRPVPVRFIISDIKPESCKFEQSFSTDDGTGRKTSSFGALFGATPF